MLGDTMALSPRVCTSLEKRTLGTSDLWERILGDPEGGGLYSFWNDGRPSRLRGGVTGVFVMRGVIVFVSMWSWGREGESGVDSSGTWMDGGGGGVDDI
jgi:hypothetical protein